MAEWDHTIVDPGILNPGKDGPPHVIVDLGTLPPGKDGISSTLLGADLTPKTSNEKPPPGSTTSPPVVISVRVHG